MRAKLILAVFLILGIIFLLFFTKQGATFVGFLKEKIPGTFSSFVALIQRPSGKYFSFLLELNRNSLVGDFEAVNSTFFAKTEEMKISVNDMPINIPKDSILRIEDGQGSFIFSENIKGKLNAKKIYVNEITFGPSDLKVEFEISASKFAIGGVKKDLITFSGLSGKLQQLAEDGSVTQTLNLENDEIKIENFFGAIKFEKDLAYLQGYATKIYGKIKGISFEWKAS